MIRIRRGSGPPTFGAVWLDIGRLRLIWCASGPQNEPSPEPEITTEQYYTWTRDLPPRTAADEAVLPRTKRELSQRRHPNIPGHPFRWMIVWRRRLPEWNPRTYWIGNEKFGRYWRGCVARLERARAGDLHHGPSCRFPKCGCPPPSPEVIEELKALAKAKRTSCRSTGKKHDDNRSL
jgi:hypothetical protein